MSHLSELQVLNLAGNNISRVENLQRLDCLTELNLRHNCISFVVRGLFSNYQQLLQSHKGKDTICSVNTISGKAEVSALSRCESSIFSCLEVKVGVRNVIKTLQSVVVVNKIQYTDTHLKTFTSAAYMPGSELIFHKKMIEIGAHV